MSLSGYKHLDCCNHSITRIWNKFYWIKLLSHLPSQGCDRVILPIWLDKLLPLDFIPHSGLHMVLGLWTGETVLIICISNYFKAPLREAVSTPYVASAFCTVMITYLGEFCPAWTFARSLDLPPPHLAGTWVIGVQYKDTSLWYSHPSWGPCGPG